MPTPPNRKSSTCEPLSIISPDCLEETIYDAACGEFQRIIWRPDGHEMRVSSVPPSVPSMARSGALLFPSELPPEEPVETAAELIAAITAFIERFFEVPPFWTRLVAHYILMTWVFDRFTALPYLRFLGEPGTGKSTGLGICRQLCYRGTNLGVAPTSAMIYRVVEQTQGTLCLDEAQYTGSGARSDIVKILNSGYKCDGVVTRGSCDDWQPQTFRTFGPKVIASREPFADTALETRILTCYTSKGGGKGMPRQLSPEYFRDAQALRNRLLLWRLGHIHRISLDEGPLSRLDGRAAEIALPIYNVAVDAGFRADFLTYVEKRSGDMAGESCDADVIEAIRDRWHGDNTPITVKEVAEAANEIGDHQEPEEKITAKRVGAILEAYGIQRTRKNTGYHFCISSEKLKELERRFGVAPKAAQASAA